MEYHNSAVIEFNLACSKAQSIGLQSRPTVGLNIWHKRNTVPNSNTRREQNIVLNHKQATHALHKMRE